jgi:hypothetical protein
MYFAGVIAGPQAMTESNFDNQHPHTRDFSRECAGVFLVLRIKEFFQKK